MKGISTLFSISLLASVVVFTSCTPKCASSDGAGTEIWLGKTKVIAPSAFTPNNQDGINDSYTFVQINQSADTSQQSAAAIKIKDFRMEISKGGQLIYETYTWGASWNGKNPKGKKMEGMVDVEYNISDVDGHVSEGSFKLFVVPHGCLQECMQTHTFGDMIHPNQGVVKQTKETFCP